MTNEELLAPIVDSLRGSTGLTARQIERQIEGWEVVPLIHHGEHMATAILKGTEIHFAIRPEYQRRLIKREISRSFLKPMFDRMGFLTTSLHRTQQMKFVERFGFAPTWSDGQVQYYILADLPFERKPT